MRIDFVITELFVGGAERCLAQLAIGMAKRGHQVRVASLASLPDSTAVRPGSSGVSDGQDALVRMLRDAEIEPFSAGCDSITQWPRAIRRLTHWMKDDPADIVQTMLIHANVVGAIAASRAGNLPCVGGVRVAEPSRTRVWLERRAMRRMKAVVCVSDSVKQFVQSNHRTDTPLFVIGNAINTVDDADKIAEADDNTLLFVGRLHHQKGLDLLFAALPTLLRQHPDMNVVLIGDGPLGTWVSDQIASLGDNRVRWLGWRQDARRFIADCRLLVLPSRFEGMPNVVMEAMAAGRPVAVTRVEGVRQLLGDGFEPQTCEPNDVAALSALIDRRWKDRDESVALGRTNRDRIRERFSVEAMLDAYERIYATLAGNEPCRGRLK